MHLEAVIEQVWRCAWRPWSSVIGGVLGHGYSGGRRTWSWDSIRWLTRICWNVENSVRTRSAKRWETATERETVDVGMLQYTLYAVLGGCCTLCTLSLLWTLDHSIERLRGMT